jgi:hypothetical protein
MHKKLLISLIAAASVAPSWAQSETTEHETSRVKWGVSAGVNRYVEPDIMRLVGPEGGLHSRITHWEKIPNAHFEGDILLGRQKYTSQSSGSINGVTNLETRWRAMLPLFSDSPTNEGFFAGVALHTLWNDLRGTSTFNGQTFGGYERSARQLWLPLRWSSGDMWDVDGGLLIYGRHTSMLSQVNSNYTDITNTQRRGQYAQVTMNVKLNNGDNLKPFVRYTHLADSNTVAMGGKKWIEPESNRWQIGAVWEFNAR